MADLQAASPRLGTPKPGGSSLEEQQQVEAYFSELLSYR